MELQRRIIEATIEEFNEKSLKFTMDDIARRLGVSKKTIYTIFSDKETLFFSMVDYCFAEIKETEQKILEDTELDIIEKIKKVLIALPERYRNIDFRQIYVMREKFPKIHKQIEQRIESEWEPTLALLEEAINIGQLKPINLPVFKIMVESSIKGFLGSPTLIKGNISYEESLEQMVEILIEGMRA